MNHYIEYLKNVLGVSEVLVTPKIHLLFINLATEPKESLDSASNSELLNKMKSAMKLEGLQVHQMDVEASKKSEVLQQLQDQPMAHIVVLMSSMPTHRGEFVLVKDMEWIETFSASYLIEDAAAKKIAWADLQKVMAKLDRFRG